MCLLIALSAGTVLAEVQTFESDIGTIKIDLPYTVELGDSSSGTSLNLVMPGTTKPIINLNMENSVLYRDFQDYASSFLSPGYTFEEMVNDDGKPMLFNVEQTGTDQDGNPTYRYRGYFDYSEDKGKYIIMHASSEARYQSETIATFTKDQFVAICKSFTVE
jgi:hypothetical protein